MLKELTEYLYYFFSKRKGEKAYENFPRFILLVEFVRELELIQIFPYCFFPFYRLINFLLVIFLIFCHLCGNSIIKN